MFKQREEGGFKLSVIKTLMEDEVQSSLLVDRKKVSDWF